MASDFAGKCKNLLYTTLLLKIALYLLTDILPNHYRETQANEYRRKGNLKAISLFELQTFSNARHSATNVLDKSMSQILVNCLFRSVYIVHTNLEL